MAEKDQIGFKVSAEVAARLTELGQTANKSANLVAKDLVLKALSAAQERSDNDSLIIAMADVREELHQLSDLVVPLTSKPVSTNESELLQRILNQLNCLVTERSLAGESNSTAIADLRSELQQISGHAASLPSQISIALNEHLASAESISGNAVERLRGEVRELSQSVQALPRELATAVRNNLPRTDPTDLSSIAHTLGALPTSLEMHEARLIAQLTSLAERSSVVPHLTEFAHKTHQYQIRQSELTAGVLSQVEAESAAVGETMNQLRHDLRRTLTLLLGYVEKVSHTEANQIVQRFLS